MYSEILAGSLHKPLQPLIGFSVCIFLGITEDILLNLVGRSELKFISKFY